MSRALAVLVRSEPDPFAKASIRKMPPDIEGGYSLSDAIERQGTYFPRLTRELVKVGEDSGSLDMVCKRLSEYYEMKVRMRRRMLGKMAYPFLQIAVVSLEHVLYRCLEIIVYTAPRDPSQMLKRPAVGIQHQLLLLAWVYPCIKTTAMTQRHYCQLECN